MFYNFFNTVYTQSGKGSILIDCMAWRPQLTKKVLIYWIWGYWNAVSRIFTKCSIKNFHQCHATTNFTSTIYTVIYQHFIRFQCLGLQDKQYFLIQDLEPWCATLFLLGRYWNAYLTFILTLDTEFLYWIWQMNHQRDVTFIFIFNTLQQHTSQLP